MMPTKRRTPEEEDAMIQAFLAPKPPTFAPSSFDINESSSPTALKGALDVPPMDDFMNFDLTMDDLPGNTPPMEPPVAPVAPPAPRLAPTPRPAPIAAKADVVPPSVDALKPAQPPVAGPSDREKMMDSLKGGDWLSVIGKALAGMGDAQLARAGGKGNFLATADAAETAGRERKIKEFDTAEAKKKEAGEYAQKNDPTSTRSKAYQDLMTELMPGKDYSKLSAAQIEEVMGPVEKIVMARETRKAREAAAAESRGNKKSAEQDRIENQAIQRISSLRGDKSLQDAEAKRDASITVYNTIDGLKRKGRMPSKLEYYDLLGQMWKARTGTAPTDQAIRDLDAKTFKGDLSKAVTYFSGKTTGATTRSVLDNIQDFAKDSGEQADKFHEGYMKPHMIKPTGLDDDRWAPIAATARGRSFADATRKQGRNPVSFFTERPTKVTSEDEALSLPKGTRFELSDGRTGTVQ